MRSATRPTGHTRSTSHARRAARSSVDDAEIRAGIRLLAETTGIFTETAGGVTTAVLAKLAEAGAIGSDERVVVVITGEGLKTLDAVREGYYIHEIDPTLESFEATVEAGRPPAAPARFPDRWQSRSRFRRSCAASPTARERSRWTARTVGEALDAVFDAHEGLRERITEDGNLRRFVNVYVSGEDIRFKEGLETELNDGDEVTILPAVAGG